VNQYNAELEARLRDLASLLLREAGELEASGTPPLEQADPDVRPRRQSYVLDSYDPLHTAWASFEYDLRQRRTRLLPANLRDGPGWIMLLDLFIHAARGKRVAITSLCIASMAPSTTALRYVKVLLSEGLVRRVPCAHDARRTYIELSDTGLRIVREYLSEATSTIPVLQSENTRASA
jgi:predicted transcriptional regulator